MINSRAAVAAAVVALKTVAPKTNNTPSPASRASAAAAAATIAGLAPSAPRALASKLSAGAETSSCVLLRQRLLALSSQVKPLLPQPLFCRRDCSRDLFSVVLSPSDLCVVILLAFVKRWPLSRSVIQQFHFRGPAPLIRSTIAAAATTTAAPEQVSAAQAYDRSSIERSSRRTRVFFIMSC